MKLADIYRRWLSLVDVESFEDFAGALAGLSQRRVANLHEALAGTEWEFQPRNGECVFTRKTGAVEVKITRVEFASWLRRESGGEWAAVRARDFHPRECQQLKGLAQNGLDVIELEADRGRLPDAIQQFRAKLEELMTAFQSAFDRDRVVEAEERLHELVAFYEEHGGPSVAKDRSSRTLPRKARRQILGVWHRWLIERLSKSNGDEQAQLFRAKLDELRPGYRSDVCAPCPREDLAEKAAELVERLEEAVQENRPESDARQRLEKFYQEHEGVLEARLRGQIGQLLSRPASAAEPPPCLCAGCQEYAALLIAEQFAARLAEIRSAPSRLALDAAWQNAYALAEARADVLLARYELKTVDELKARLQTALDHGLIHNFPPDPPKAFCASKDLPGRIVLRWQHANDAEKYILRRAEGAATGPGPAGFRVEVQATGEDTLEFPDTVVTTGQSYQFWIVARNQFGESSPAGPAEGMAVPGTKGSDEDTIWISEKLLTAGTKAEEEGDVASLAALYQAGERESKEYEFLAKCLCRAAGKRVRLWEEQLSAATAPDQLAALELDRDQVLDAFRRLIEQEKRMVPLTTLRDGCDLADGFVRSLASGRKAFKFAAYFQDKLRAVETAEQAEQRQGELESWELRELGTMPALLKQLADALALAEARINWTADFRKRISEAAHGQVQALQAELDGDGSVRLAGHPRSLSELRSLLKKRAGELSEPGQRAEEFAAKFRADVDQVEAAGQLTDLSRQLGAANVGVLADRPELQNELAGLVESTRQRLDFGTRFLKAADAAQARDELAALERMFGSGTSQWRLAPAALRQLAGAKETAQQRVDAAEGALRQRIHHLAEQAWRPADLAAGKAVLEDPVHVRLLRGNPALQQQLEQQFVHAGQMVLEIAAFLQKVGAETVRAFSQLDLARLRELIRAHQRLWQGKDQLTRELEHQAEAALQQVQKQEQELRTRVAAQVARAWQQEHLAGLEDMLQEPGPQALTSGNAALRHELLGTIAQAQEQVARAEALLTQAGELAAQPGPDEEQGRLRRLIASHRELCEGKPGLSERLESIATAARQRAVFLEDLTARVRLVFAPAEMSMLEGLVAEHQALLEADPRRTPKGQSASAQAVAALLTQARTQIAGLEAFGRDARQARTPEALTALFRKLDAPPFSEADPKVRERLARLRAEAEARVEFAGELTAAARAVKRRPELGYLDEIWNERPPFDCEWEADLEAEMRAAEARVNIGWFQRHGTKLVLTVLLLAAAAGAYLQFWPSPPVIDRFPKDATREHPWTNSLGMKLVPVILPDKRTIHFSIWETRVRDFEAFVKATGHDATAGMTSLRADGHRPRGDSWREPGFMQTPQQPVCGVDWEDAKEFCRWLTVKERTEGRLAASQEYRLPTDAEWSAAAGIGDREEPGSPKEKDGKLKGVYPWGSQWPPPPGAGNYADQTAQTTNWPADFSILDGYRDGFARTAPVGSFAANPNGLHDLGGNVWEFCEDWYDAARTYRLLRGGGWDTSDPGQMLSSYRGDLAPGTRHDFVGFRVVLANVGDVK